MRRSAFVTLLGVVALSVALLSGCAEKPKSTDLPGPKPAQGSVSDEPGIHRLPDGRVRVVGMLTVSDLEGGFTGVQLQRPEDSRTSTTVVIVNAAKVPGIERAKAEGWVYVAVTGRLLHGASIRMAGPEMEADGIERLDQSEAGSGATGTGSPAGGTRIADGLYDLEGGTVQAMGTLRYDPDVEAGYWFVDSGGKRIASIVNGRDYARQLEPLVGSQVLVIGKRYQGASVPLPSPVIEMASVQQVSDTSGAAE